MLPQQLTPRGDWRVAAEAAPDSGPGPGQSKLTITRSNRGYLTLDTRIIGIRQSHGGYTNIRRILHTTATGQLLNYEVLEKLSCEF